MKYDDLPDEVKKKVDNNPLKKHMVNIDYYKDVDGYYVELDDIDNICCGIINDCGCLPTAVMWIC